LNAILRYPGAKWSTAEQLIKYFPTHKGYLEPYFGSGGVLFNKQKSGLETVNDIDGEVVNFFKVLKHDYRQLETDLKLTPYSRDVYIDIQSYTPKYDVERAYKFFLMSWMSHAGYSKHKTSWSHSKDPAGPNKANIFKNVTNNLKDYAERLREVQIENTEALKLIKAHDFKNTLIYLDPPYHLSTRKQNLYKHEMDNNGHIKLLDLVVSLENAKVLISGYDCQLYNEKLKTWNKETFKNVDGKGNIKQEVVWFNYDLHVQETLF